MKDVNVIIVAGGSGSRMGASIPKQFLDLKGKPILLRTLENFHACLPDAIFTIVMPEVYFDHWNTILTELACDIPHSLIAGGATRKDSVLNGLSQVSTKYVMIHDGVRPFVTSSIIERCIQGLSEKGNAVPCVPIIDSIREKIDEGNVARNRDNYVAVQTPQCFVTEDIIQSYSTSQEITMSDDASVYEGSIGPINLVEGSRDNIKITTPVDIVLGEAILG